MKAAWLERRGKAEPRLTVGERPMPGPGAEDVLLTALTAMQEPSICSSRWGA
ncbi:MAG: hypothetical protein IKN81_10280 [Oscillospiraceae bacterium]|nr:hypothetical protein [Oscillospiraceae bacterium]